ncbi:MFS transporter [Phycicoccus sp. CSK15P-2]|nr:MFS transporter [Phycicoccus sp. CSK15P-2]
MLDPYRRVLGVPAVRRALLLGAVIRVPVFATPVVVTLHVVTTLGRSYAEAGLVASAATLSIAVSGPWRGRLLDRLGLRRVVAPSVVVSGAAWAMAPWVGYPGLLALVLVAGLFVVPSFTVFRQVLLAAVPEKDRRTAISLDSSLLEVLFMLAPAVAVWAATAYDTRWVLFGVQMLGAVAGMALWALDPRLRAEGEAGPGAADIPRRTWLRAPFAVVCLVAAGSTVVLVGAELGFVAALRQLGSVELLGVVLALWAAGSFVGGIVYGGLPREVRSRWLLAGLAVTTVPMAVATSVWTLAVLSFVAGLLCAPTVTATIDEAARIVPARARGEAMGWHGSSITVGAAAGAPVAGATIDAYGPVGGFVVLAAVGLVIALVAGLFRSDDSADVPSEVAVTTTG